ncbi:MAG: hypothetical protein JWP58_3823 [Hymenobacter sp.]|nr:hypothetical protein [Hymenobacter sp.]
METITLPPTTATETFLAEILAAHGGLKQWRKFTKVSSQVVSGGFLWAMKGMPLDDLPRTITSEFRRQWTRVDAFGNPDWHMIYEPHHLFIETQAGEIIAEQYEPRDTFSGHAWETPWTPLHLAYFNGYAMWTYYNLPFILSEPGFQLTEISPVMHEGQRFRGLRVRFPEGVHTHSREQNLYFDDSGLLRRQDYQVDVAGKTSGAHFISDYVDVQGLKFATKRRVHPVNADGTLQFDRTIVSIDLSDFQLS